MEEGGGGGGGDCGQSTAMGRRTRKKCWKGIVPVHGGDEQTEQDRGRQDDEFGKTTI